VSDPRAAPKQPEPLAGWRWWTGLSVGGAVGLLGLAGLLRDATKTMPLVWLKWLVGLVLVHDFVLAPLVLLAGRRLRDRAPEPWCWPLRLGLVTSGVLVLASVPVLYGVGRRTQPGNASVLPDNYPLALSAFSSSCGWASSLSGSGALLAGADEAIARPASRKSRGSSGKAAFTDPLDDRATSPYLRAKHLCLPDRGWWPATG
jgi:hypothetical protein